MMSKERMDRILAEVKENHKRLEGCDGHDFSVDMNPDKVIGKEWGCTRCGGVVSNEAKQWYEKGLEHGY